MENRRIHSFSDSNLEAEAPMNPKMQDLGEKPSQEVHTDTLSLTGGARAFLLRWQRDTDNQVNVEWLEIYRSIALLIENDVSTTHHLHTAHCAPWIALLPHQL